MGKLKSQKPTRFFKHTSLFVLVLFASILINALLFFKNETQRNWQQTISEFRFLVLNQNVDSVQVDEVGRYIKQQDGVLETTLISPEEAYQKMLADPILAGPLKNLTGNPFPSLWEVSWEINKFDISKTREFLDDLKTLPGVKDIAYDDEALVKIHDKYIAYLQLKTLLALAFSLSIAFIAMVLLSAFATGFNFQLKIALGGLIRDVVAWSGGGAVIWFLLGPFPPALLFLGGIAVLATTLKAMEP